ncbi:MAG: CHAT domain-containing tetratricopeptide repeat protein [Acidobacteriota bacterium]
MEHVAKLADDEQRQQFLHRHREIIGPDLVPQLTAEVARLFAVDLERARGLAETARWLAEKLDDEKGRALAERSAANVAHSLGETDRAQRLYEQAVGRFEQLPDLLEAAITRTSALLNLAFLGQHSQALEWYRAAKSTFEGVGDRRRLANLEHNFGIILVRQDRWEEALDCYRYACGEFRHLDRVQDVAICLRNIAVCHIHLHDFIEALRAYRAGRDYCVRHGLTRILLQIDYNIAYLYYLRGEYTRAIQLFQSARRDCEAAGDDYHTALCDLDQAEIYLDLNLVEEAADLALAAFTVFARLKIPYETAKALTFRAIALSRQGRSPEPIELLGRARDIFVDEHNQLWPALIDFYHAVVLAREQQPRAAVRLARGARETFTKLDMAPRAAMCELHLAELQLALDEVQRARSACNDAFERLADLDLPALEHRAHLVLGQVEEASGDRAAALNAYQRSHRLLEQLRSQLPGDDLKIAFLKDKHAVYESLVWLTLEDPGTSAHAKQAHAEQAFAYIEAAKSRSLVDLMGFRAHTLVPRSPAASELGERVLGLREELNWLYRQIDTQEMRTGERPRQSLEGLRNRTRHTEEALLRALRELRTADLEFSSLQSASVIDLETIRSSLPPEATLIEYFIARGEIFVCVLTHDQLVVDRVATARQARKLHRFLQLQLSTAASHTAQAQYRAEQTAGQPRPGVDPGHQAMHAHLTELYRVLIEPIREHLRGDHLVMVPHGFLHYVPFHALHDGTCYLIDRFTLSYAPSAEVFHLCSIKETDCTDTSLVLGVADDRAPHILEEAEAVASSLPDATLLLGEAASAEALRQRGSACRYLHIATHGLFRRDNPIFSAIQLGTERLSLFDLYELCLNAELVVLSGCGTGLNAVLGGEELVGLTRGLLYAGAQSVLVTLWDVHDVSTAAFMRSFYEHLSAGSGRAQALRHAMLDLRRAYPSPYHWAPFVLVGKPAASSK